jgi:putative oxidoreductase
MRKIIFHPILLFVAKWFLGFVFIFAGIEKIAAPEIFAISVEAYKLIPVSVVNLFALVLPWIEVLCGIFLIGCVYVRASTLIVSSILTMFIFAILSAMARQLKIDCGCFGQQYSSVVGWPKVFQDIGLLALGIYINLSATRDTSAGDGDRTKVSSAPLTSG